jgi:hypothetical protein
VTELKMSVVVAAEVALASPAVADASRFRWEDGVA